MSQKVIEMDFPKADPEILARYQVATPVSKMPDCDNCGEDELGMLSPDEAFCYQCCAIVKRKP